jgi:hypothetical protein
VDDTTGCSLVAAPSQHGEYAISRRDAVHAGTHRAHHTGDFTAGREGQGWPHHCVAIFHAAQSDRIIRELRAPRPPEGTLP